MMHPVWRRNVIQKGVKEWLDSHLNGDTVFGHGNNRKSAASIRDALLALDLATCSQEDVDQVLGTPGWTANECDECGGGFPVLMHIGDTPDYDMRWQCLCAGCLMKAYEMLVTASVEADTSRSNCGTRYSVP